MKYKRVTIVALLFVGCTLFFCNIVLLCYSSQGAGRLVSVATRLDSTSWPRQRPRVPGRIRDTGSGRNKGIPESGIADLAKETRKSESLESGSRRRVSDGFDGRRRGNRPPRSKEEIAFLRLLKNLTKTTVQTPKSCTGANRSLIDTQDGGNRADLSEKFLLPVMLGNQGPNNQIQAFRFVVAVAMQRNYTLVLAPFFNHPTVDELDMRCFEDTLDPAALRRLVPSISMEGFRETCQGRVDTVLIGTRVGGLGAAGQSEDHRRGLELYMDGQTQMFAEMTGIHIPSIVFHRQDPRILIDLPDDTPNHAIKLKDYLSWYPDAFRSESRCLAFVYPYGLLGRFPHQEYVTLLSKYLIRPKKIRHLADEFLLEIGGNEADVVCIHWRFNAEWNKFWCSSRGNDVCNILSTLSIQRVAQSLGRLMGRYRRGILYFASPSGEQKGAIEAALRLTVSPFYSSVDIREALGDRSHRHNPLREILLGDQYHLSLLEQEICSRSKLFIGSELSSWTENVMAQRRAEGLENRYILDVLKSE